MSKLVKIYARPKLNTPNMLACWPGISNVSTIAANYLKRKLNFKKLAEVDAINFFDPTGVLAEDSVIEAPRFPQSEFYYWKNKTGGSDLILFIGEDQPAAKGYELANCVLDLGLRFQAKRIYTIAAALTRIHPTEESRVWGVATKRELAKELEMHNLSRTGNLQIAGLNGLLLGIAKERDIEGVCLLGEVPMNSTRIQNPIAALAILKTFTEILDIQVDTTELALLAEDTKEKMRQAAAMAMGEYIDYFTEPIWEQNGEDDEDDEDK
ncbi:PAC2 family protein [Chloroflexota bacterium]